MGQDRPDFLRSQASLQQRLLRVLQMLLRILLIIIVVEVSDGHPMLLVLPKVPRKAPHGYGHILGVEEQMFLGGGCA